ncbi:type II and III secretion system protein [Rubrivirga sp.]|uniref:type II and III secretion system protein n=1 Tax=Rubrivirga sp. TaxID=1885344 RepID=UPI003B5167CF
MTTQPSSRPGRARSGPAWALLAALMLAAPVVAPVAQAQGRVVRGYVPPDELVSFPSTTPMSQFFRLVNPTFFRVTGKRVVDPADRSDPIGVALNGVHFIDAFELVLDRHGLDFSESEGYFIVTEPQIVATTTDGAVADPIGAVQPVTAAATVELPATAETREVRIDAVIFQLNSRRAREVGANWPALFGEAVASGSGGTGSAGGDDGRGAETKFYVNAGSFFDALDGFIEATNDRIELSQVLNVFRYFEEQGYGQTVATPFTVVQSGEQGRLQSGQDIPVTVRDFQGNAITQFFSTGTIIEVTPTLIVDEREGDPVEFIHLNVKVEKSTAIPSGDGVAINKDNVTTQLPVLSGEMRAVGGLTSTDETTVRRGVPILRDIPLLNFFFSYKQRQVQQNEIIIVLRARVADDMRTRQGQELPRELLQRERENADERVRRFGIEPLPQPERPPVEIPGVDRRRDAQR